MLTLQSGYTEVYDETTNEFVKVEPFKVRLEHSLISISKWEAIWEKPFIPTSGLKPIPKSEEELRSYIQCMVIGPPLSDGSIDALLYLHSDTIDKYINASHTATTISRGNGPSGPSQQKIVTSELIYYWMITFGIPMSCERWHINRLMVLIEICEIKASKNNKKSKRDLHRDNYNLNAARRAAMGLK